jgi:acetylornithine/N-succinyldiaminopimelate aminotransferase
VQVADLAYVKSLRELCRSRDILLILDEVQTGMGRTGALFAYEHYGIQPDIMTLAKGLGGGLPIGACLATDGVAAAFTPGVHASTFGGNPLACSAALAVMRVLLEGRLLARSKEVGQYMATSLLELKDRLPNVKDVRGLGLLQGMELSIDGTPVVADCLNRGLLINCTMDRVLRFVPPLIITQREIDRLIDVLADVLGKRV